MLHSSEPHSSALHASGHDASGHDTVGPNASGHHPFGHRARRGNALALLLVVVALVGAALFLVLAPGGGSNGTARIEDETTAAQEETDLGPVALTTDEKAGEDARRSAQAVVGDGDEPVGAEREDGAGRSASVTGRVTNASGLPVVGARVSVVNGGFGGAGFFIGERRNAGARDTVETDARGAFALETRARGERTLRVECSGFVRHEVEGLELALGATEDVGTLVLDTAVVLSGRVVDPAGRGIEGVELFEVPRQEMGGMVIALDVPMGGEPLTTTGPAGDFTIDTLAVGDWKVQARHPEHPMRSFDGTTEREGEVQRDLLFELPYGARIAGFVTGTDRREGPFQVVARSGGIFGFAPNPPTADVAEDGSFEIVGLEEGTEYEVQVVSAAGEGDVFEAISLGGMQEAISESVSVEAPAVNTRLEILAPGRIRIQVTTGQPPVPLETFTASYGRNWNMVALRGEDGSVLEQHEDGIAVFEEVNSIGDAMPWGGSPSVRIEAEGYLRLDVPVSRLPAPGELLDLGAVVLEPASGARITVVAEGRPVRGARVRIGRATERGFETGDIGVSRAVSIDASSDEGGDLSIEDFGGGNDSRGRTDEEGLVVLDLPAKSGSFRLTVEHRDWADYAATVEVPPGAMLEHTVELGPGGVVLVRVVDERGQPLEGVSVAHRGPGSGGMAAMFGGGTKSDAQGEVEFAKLTPGTHRFRTQPDAGDGPLAFVSFGGVEQSDWTDAVVEHGTRTELVLTAVAKASLAGQVRQDGAPLAGAKVSLRPVDDGGSDGTAEMAMFAFGGGPSATTDANGRYAIESAGAGAQELVVTHPDRALPAVFELDVVPGVENLHDVDLFRNGIRGVVRGEDGDPLAGLTVRAQRAGDGDSPSQAIMAIASDVTGGAVSMFGGGETQSVETDAEGRFELVGLPEDVEVLVVVDASTEAPFTFSVESEPLRVGMGEWVEGVELVAPPAASLRIEVSSEIQEKLFFVIASLERLDDAGQAVEGSSRNGFGEDGVITLDGLEPGRYRVRLEGAGPEDGAPPYEREVVVVEGERTTLPFE